MSPSIGQIVYVRAGAYSVQPRAAAIVTNVYEVMPMEAAAEAFNLMDRGGYFLKIVLSVG